MRSDQALRGGLTALATLTTAAAIVGYVVSPSPSASARPQPPGPVAAAYTAPAQVLAPDTTTSSTTAPLPSTAGLAKLLGAGMTDSALGKGAGVVADAATGKVLYSDAATTPVIPASTGKLAVAVSALELLNPTFRLHTDVVDGGGNRIVLVGGGDPTLSTGTTPPGDPGFQPAQLSTLASDTARALRAAKRTSVTVAYDTSLYSGPDWQSTWPIDDQDGSIAPVEALEVDEGRTDPSADESGRVAQPAIFAELDFAKDLALDGITVTGLGNGPVSAPAHGATLASVASPPLSDLVQHMLTVSDNSLAEALARQVALASGQPASFTGEANAVRAEIGRLGVDTTGMAMLDACGLSHSDRMTVLTLAQTLALAASSDHPKLRATVTGLPVGNFTGTLDVLDRYATGLSAAGAGLVRAKTGTLDSVNGLAGLVRDADGRLLVFVFLSNDNSDGIAAIRRLDDMATQLLGCGCH